MSEKAAIKVEGVSKIFRLPREKNNSVKSAVINFYQRNKSYENLEALKDISFEINKGEFFGIVGRNGSGKSTLLKILAGIYSPSQGDVHVNGRLTPFIELGVGFNPELTGRENIFLNGALLGFSRKEMQKMYDSIVDFAELERFMDQKLKNYSSGMQVRLAFSIAIRAEKDILLLDEVLAVGDTAFQRKCYDYFTQLKKNKQTVVLVTHDMGAIQKYCDRALMIQDSEVIAIGEPRKIAMRYELANVSSSSGVSVAKLQRPNNPNVKILDLKLNTDNETKHFSTEDEVKIKVKLEIKKPIEIQMNLYLLNDKDVYLAGINTTKDLKKYKPSIGIKTLSCTIKAGQLAKGEYNVGLGVYTLDEVPELIDIIDKNYNAVMPRISIVEKSEYQDGEFYINGKWSEVTNHA